MVVCFVNKLNIFFYIKRQHLTIQSTSQCEYSLENELKLDSIELDDPSVLHIYGYEFMKVPFDVISSTAFQAEEEYIIFVAQFSTTL